MLYMVLDIGHTVIVAGILIYLVVTGLRTSVSRQGGWWLIVAGFSFLFIGMLGDLAEHQGVFSPEGSRASTILHVWVENAIGNLLGLALLALGLLRWMPTIIDHQRVVEMVLRLSSERLGSVPRHRAAMATVADWLRRENVAREQMQARLAATLAESQQRQKESSALLLAACTVLEQQSLRQTSTFLFNACKNLVGATDGYIALPSRDGQPGQRPFVAVSGGECSEVLPVPPSLEVLRDQACNTGRVMYANNLPVSQWAAFPDSPSIAVTNLLLAPLLIKGNVVGLLGLVNKPEEFVDNDAYLAEAFADLIALGLYNRQLVEKLEASEQRLRSVVETASDAIVTADAEGRIISWNRAAQAMFGYTEAEVTGQPLALVIPERLRAQHEAGLRRVATSGAGRIMGQTIQMVGVRQSGAEFPLELSLANWQTDEGAFFTALMRDITERKRVQEALREANQALEGLIEASPLPILALTPQRTITLWNRAAEETFGWTEEEVIGQVSPIVPPGRVDEFWAVTERALRGEPLMGVETRRNRRDGTPIELSIWTAALHDAGGNVNGAVAVMADITARKQAEEAVRRHADEQTALYTIAAAVSATLTLDELLPAVLDATLPVLQADAAWILCPGPTPEDPLRMIASRSAAATPARAEILLQGGQCPVFEHRNGIGNAPGETGVIVDCSLPLDGGLVLAEGQHVCLPLTAAGQVLGVLKVAWLSARPAHASNEALLLTIGRQIGMALHNAQLYEAASQVDRLRMLSELDRALAASLDLRLVAEETLKHVAAHLHAPLGVLLLMQPGLQPGAESLLVLGHGWNGSGPVVDARIWWPIMERKIEMKAGPAALTDLELAEAGCPPDLARRWGAHGLVTAIWGEEDLLAVLALGGRADDRPFGAEDRTLLQVAVGRAGQALQNAQLYEELKRLLCEREMARAQLVQSEKVAALGRLVASIAHEINNPLQAIDTYLTLMDEELAGSREQAKLERYLHVVQGETERVSSIMHRLREYYRPAPRRSEPVQVQAVLPRVLELIEQELQRARIQVTTSWPHDLPTVAANPDHLRQVFLNMMLNAIDAMPQGGTLHVRAGLDEIATCEEEPPTPAVCVEFRDSGLGMSAETLARLFEPFFTTKANGAGLGLYVSYGLIEAHHGQIRVNSQEGEGTSFSVLLPVLQMETSP